MTRALKIALPCLILLAGVFCVTRDASAKPEYTRKEHKGCTYCHSKANSKPAELTEAGKYYAEHKSLEGYKK